MMLRETLWYDEDRQVRQVEVTLLDAIWEPVWRVVRTLGPFDKVEDELLALREEGRAWFNLHGEQLGLWDSPPTP